VQPLHLGLEPSDATTLDEPIIEFPVAIDLSVIHDDDFGYLIMVALGKPLSDLFSHFGAPSENLRGLRATE
jgi:hypothetical protein